jgi:hypothetical protein
VQFNNATSSDQQQLFGVQSNISDACCVFVIRVTTVFMQQIYMYVYIPIKTDPQWNLLLI